MRRNPDTDLRNRWHRLAGGSSSSGGGVTYSIVHASKEQVGDCTVPWEIRYTDGRVERVLASPKSEGMLRSYSDWGTVSSVRKVAGNPRRRKKNPRKIPSTRIDTSGGKRRQVQEARYRLEDLQEDGFFLSEKGWYYRRTPYESPEYLPSSIVKLLQAHVANGSSIPRRLLSRLADPTRKRLRGSGR